MSSCVQEISEKLSENNGKARQNERQKVINIRERGKAHVIPMARTAEACPRVTNHQLGEHRAVLRADIVARPVSHKSCVRMEL